MLKSVRRFLAKSNRLKDLYKYFLYLIFQFNCVVWDLRRLPKTYALSKTVAVKNSNIALICSLDFYINRKWQVVSQTDLWYKFVDENNCLLIGSFISYWLFGRNKKTIVTLEPKYNAPLFEFSKDHNKVIAFVSDSHSKKWLPKYIKNKRVTDLLTPYKKTLINTGFSIPLKDENVHSFAWCVEDKLLNEVTIDTIDGRVLGFGKTGSSVYDLREWSFETGLLSTFDFAGSGNKVYAGVDYYLWLRTFDASVVAMSTIPLYNYTVAKYFEIPSQGLLLFAFKTVDLEDFGFVDGVNYISVTKENFHDEIEKYRSNPEQYLEIRKQGYNLIKSHHTVSKRLEQLNKILTY